MNTNRNTDQLFEHMRNAPVDVPLENVEKFVIAQAALGITAVGASKGIFTKAFLKFHLNSILIMTTTATAALISIFVWASHGDNVSADNNLNHKSNFKFSEAALIPGMEVDSPKVVTTNMKQNGEDVSVTTVQTETGTNIKIVTLGDGQTKVYYNNPNDSNYTFAYGIDNKPGVPVTPAVPPVYNYAYGDFAPLVNVGTDVDVKYAFACSKSCYDSLTKLLEKSLLKDGLITDTLDYTFKITGSSLAVNGKKQNKEQWRKYKELIESNSNYRIHHFFVFTQYGNSTSCCVAMDPMEPMPAMEPMQPMQPMEPMQSMEPLGEMSYTFKSCNDTLMTKLEHVMLQDGLIKDTLHYSFKINGSYLKVNGEKQSKEQWKKYKDIIESNSLNKVNRSFSYAISRDGDDTSIDMQNFID